MTGPADRDRGGPPEGLLELGRIVRPHGIRGEVVVEPVTNRPERFEHGASHTTPGGSLAVERARRHRGRWIVAYEGVADRDAAESLRGTPLFGEPIDVLDDDEVWVHEIVDAEVVDGTGEARGRVVAVEVNPAHDLLVLDTGALVPVVFVSDVEEGRVVVDAPEGLFDEELLAANRPGVEGRPGRRKRRERRERRRRGGT